MHLAYGDPSFRMVGGRFDFSGLRRPTWSVEEAADAEVVADYSHDVEHVLVDGDIVTIHSHATLRTAHRGDPRKGFDITDPWRVVDGEIVEHWDSVQPIELFAQSYMLVTAGRVRNGSGTYRRIARISAALPDARGSNAFRHTKERA